MKKPPYQYVLWSDTARQSNTPDLPGRLFFKEQYGTSAVPWSVVGYPSPLSLADIERYKMTPITEGQAIDGYQFITFSGWQSGDFDKKVTMVGTVQFAESLGYFSIIEQERGTDRKYVGDYYTYPQLIRRMYVLGALPPFVKNELGDMPPISRPLNPVGIVEMMLKLAPLKQADYMSERAFKQHYFSFWKAYQAAGPEQFSEALRTVPYTGKPIKPGTYLLDESSDQYGRPIGQLVDMPFSELKNINRAPFAYASQSEFLSDVERYVKWFNQGLTPPPISVHQTATSLELYIVDGFKRVQAALATGRDSIPAVLYPVVPHPQQIQDRYTRRELYTPATLELIQEFAGVEIERGGTGDQKALALAKAAAEQKILAYQLKFL